MTTDVQVSVSEDPESQHLYPYFPPIYTLGCLACFLGEADPQDSRNINCSGHKFCQNKMGVDISEIALSSGQNLKLS